MIECNGIVKRFGRVTAVAGATFQVPSATICGFLGPNGAGKTTTLRVLVGALAPDSGTLSVDGINPAADPTAARQRVGYLAEESPLYHELTVEEFVTFRAEMYGVPRKARAAAVDRALQRSHAQEVRRRLCGQLSKGYKQRCGVAAAIVHNPPVIVLDEPTSGMDPAQAAELRALLRTLAQECTVLLSSHVLAEVEAVCDRAVLINRGTVRAQGTLDDLRTRGASTATLLVESNRDLTALLRALPGVSEVATAPVTGGWFRTEVRAGGASPELAEAAGIAAFRAGATVRRLEWKVPTLEDVFHRLIADRSGA